MCVCVFVRSQTQTKTRMRTLLRSPASWTSFQDPCPLEQPPSAPPFTGGLDVLCTLLVCPQPSHFHELSTTLCNGLRTSGGSPAVISRGAVLSCGFGVRRWCCSFVHSRADRRRNFSSRPVMLALNLRPYSRTAFSSRLTAKDAGGPCLSLRLCLRWIHCICGSFAGHRHHALHHLPPPPPVSPPLL